ncbi:GNAT family N-acetyltransferase [Streptomyces venezuelae]|uniref:GNAT family N-acetyltransferase n=1 Tax=Streptomyces venezuelae TaxID=54571 RepID=A0A5P2C740_STRVZ|nr:GNAT family N-acetyltransferase [Streptomyces venezuelae]QES38514.1 GNAT family N-acetyltransferase [Streptomyces venezuelae]
MTAIDLRPATAADSEYCFQLHRAAMGDHITSIWSWDEGTQRGFHASAFTPDRWQIVTADGTDVGMLHVEHRPTEIYLARIEIHPDHQGSGIGSLLIRGLLHQARRQGQDLALDVLVVNERARALYQRLGLHEEFRHGENNIKIRMTTKPSGPERDEPERNEEAAQGRHAGDSAG